EEQEDEEDRRSEAEQQALPPGRARVERLRIDGDLVVLEELRERVRVGEGRDLRPEEVGRLRAVVALLLREVALDRRSLRGDRLHMSGLDLVEEERGVGDAHARRRPGRPRDEEDVERKRYEEEDDPAGARPK